MLNAFGLSRSFRSLLPAFRSSLLPASPLYLSLNTKRLGTSFSPHAFLDFQQQATNTLILPRHIIYLKSCAVFRKRCTSKNISSFTRKYPETEIRASLDENRLVFLVESLFQYSRAEHFIDFSLVHGNEL